MHAPHYYRMNDDTVVVRIRLCNRFAVPSAAAFVVIIVVNRDPRLMGFFISTAAVSTKNHLPVDLKVFSISLSMTTRWTTTDRPASHKYRVDSFAVLYIWIWPSMYLFYMVGYLLLLYYYYYCGCCCFSVDRE